MSQILEVRLEDGSTAALDASLVAGVSFNGVSTTPLAFAQDTGFSPPPGAGASVNLRTCVYDPTANLVSCQEWNVALRKSALGVLVVAGDAQVGANIGDGALTADVTTAFSVSADNTLIVTTGVGAYPNACTVAGVITTAAVT